MLNIYICIAIVFDGTSFFFFSLFLDAKHLPVMWSNPCRKAEQRRRQPITFFVYWRLRDQRIAMTLSAGVPPLGSSKPSARLFQALR